MENPQIPETLKGDSSHAPSIGSNGYGESGNLSAAPTPWYESNLIWGPGALAVAIILVVLPSAWHVLRWLLLLAWACLCLPIWFFAKARLNRHRWKITIGCWTLAGAVLILLAMFAQSSPEKSSPPSKSTAVLEAPKQFVGGQATQPAVTTTLSISRKAVFPKKQSRLAITTRAETQKPTEPGSAQPPKTNNQYCPGGICANGDIIGSPQINNYGKRVPPNREILLSDAQSAIEQLHKASGATVRFVTVGSTSEIENFSGNVRGLFIEAGWKFDPTSSHTDNYSDFEPTTGSVYHGEGVGCTGRPGSEAFEAVKSAMIIAGYPCKELEWGPEPASPLTFDVLVVVGTRIQPEE